MITVFLQIRNANSGSAWMRTLQAFFAPLHRKSGKAGGLAAHNMMDYSSASAASASRFISICATTARVELALGCSMPLS